MNPPPLFCCLSTLRRYITGRCHQGGGRLGRALKYFVAVRKHYDDMREDQFDFHSYCLRKMTLRSYVHLLRAEVRRVEEVEHALNPR